MEPPTLTRLSSRDVAERPPGLWEPEPWRCPPSAFSSERLERKLDKLLAWTRFAVASARCSTGPLGSVATDQGPGPPPGLPQVQKAGVPAVPRQWTAACPPPPPPLDASDPQPPQDGWVALVASLANQVLVLEQWKRDMMIQLAEVREQHEILRKRCVPEPVPEETTVPTPIEAVLEANAGATLAEVSTSQSDDLGDWTAGLQRRLEDQPASFQTRRQLLLLRGSGPDREAYVETIRRNAVRCKRDGSIHRWSDKPVEVHARFAHLSECDVCGVGTAFPCVNAAHMCPDEVCDTKLCADCIPAFAPEYSSTPASPPERSSLPAVAEGADVRRIIAEHESRATAAPGLPSSSGGDILERRNRHRKNPAFKRGPQGR